MHLCVHYSISIKKYFLIFLNVINFINAVCRDTATVTWTSYNVTYEDDFVSGSDISLQNCDISITFEIVGVDFAEAIRSTGSGFLSDGTYIQLASCCNPCVGDDCWYNCFEQASGPLGSHGNVLVPYVSVGSNDIDYGTIVKVANLEGLELLGGSIHNGCVRVDDVCDTCDHPNWLSWYVQSYSNKLWLTTNSIFTISNIEYPSDCEIQTYYQTVNPSNK